MTNAVQWGVFTVAYSYLMNSWYTAHTYIDLNSAHKHSCGYTIWGEQEQAKYLRNGISVLCELGSHYFHSIHVRPIIDYYTFLTLTLNILSDLTHAVIKIKPILCKHTAFSKYLLSFIGILPFPPIKTHYYLLSHLVTVSLPSSFSIISCSLLLSAGCNSNKNQVNLQIVCLWNSWKLPDIENFFSFYERVKLLLSPCIDVTDGIIMVKPGIPDEKIIGSGYFYGTVNDTRLAILTAIAHCHGYHVIFRQSALSWGDTAPQTPCCWIVDQSFLKP